MTYFAVDMHSPGVEVRPLRQITGEAEFNEVYLTDVRIPDANRIGAVGRGLAGRADHADERAHGDRRRRGRRPIDARRQRTATPCRSGRPRPIRAHAGANATS